MLNRIQKNLNPEYLLVVIFILSLALYISYLPFCHVGLIIDDSFYLLLAKSLQHGKFTVLSNPSSPPMTLFLPGYPFFLIPFVVLLQPHWDALRWVSILLTGSTVALGWYFFRSFLSPWMALLALAGYACHPYTARLASCVMTEPFFLFLTFAIFLAFQRVLNETRWSLLILLVLVTWQALVRPEGMIFIPAVATGLIAKNKKRAAFLIIVTPLICGGAFHVRNMLMSQDTVPYVPRWTASMFFLFSHPTLLAENWHRVSHFLIVRSALGVRIAYSSAGKWLNTALVGAVLFLMGRGFKSFWKKGGTTRATALGIALYGGLYFCVHLLWPAIDGRYAIPLLPIILLFIAEGLGPSAETFHGRSRLAIFALFMICSLVYGNVVDWHEYYSERKKVESEWLQDTFQWIRVHIAPDALFETIKTGPLYLYTGRHAIVDLEASDREDLRQRWIRLGVTHVLSVPMRPLYRPRPTAQPIDLWNRDREWIASWPEAFEVLYRNLEEQSVVYKVLPDPHFMEAYTLFLAAKQDLIRSSVDEGIRKLEKALALYPDFPAALNSYGTACLLSNRPLKIAEARLKRALALRPKYPLALWNLSRVYRKTGRTGLARETLRKAREAIQESGLSLDLFSAITEEWNQLGAVL